MEFISGTIGGKAENCNNPNICQGALMFAAWLEIGKKMDMRRTTPLEFENPKIFWIGPKSSLEANDKVMEFCFYLLAVPRPRLVVSKAKLRFDVMAWIPADVQKASAGGIRKMENIQPRAANSGRLRMRNFNLNILVIHLHVVRLFFFPIHINHHLVEICSNKQAGAFVAYRTRGALQYFPNFFVPRTTTGGNRLCQQE